MSFRHVTGFLLFVMIVSVRPGWGQMIGGGDSRRTFSIDGVALDDTDQHRLPEVRVELTSTSAESIELKMTDGTGRFEITGILAGDYVIELTLQGYETIQEPITLRNSTLHGLSFSMRKSETAAETSSQALVSAHELNVPKKARDEYQKGLELFDSKDYQGAIGQFQRAIKDYPTFYEAYAKQGSAYGILNQTPDAEKSFRKSVELSADKYPEGLFLLAGLLNNTNRSAEAEALCRKGIALDGSSALGHFELARALVALKRPDEAEKNMLQARDLMPGNLQVYLFLTNIHIQKRDYPAALKDIGDYLKLDPSSPTAEQIRKTQASLQAAVGTTPQSPQVSASQPAKSGQPKAKKQPAPGNQESSDSGEDDAPSLMPPPSLGGQ